MTKNRLLDGTAETGESVTLRRSRKRKRWDSQRSFTPDTITLGAMGMGVKHYNAVTNSSTIQARCRSDTVSTRVRCAYIEDGWQMDERSQRPLRELFNGSNTTVGFS